MTESTRTLHPWRALHWEPVSGTGERLMVGVVYRYESTWGAARILSDSVLDCLYGKSASAARKLIDTGLEMYREAARAGDSLEALGMPLMGLHPSELRNTDALSVADLLRTAAVLYSSLANLDKIDAFEEADVPANEEINRRFATELREAVLKLRPQLETYFGRSATLVEGGDSVRFGFASPRLLAHFNVLNPMRVGPSLRDARARLFELSRGQRIAGIRKSTLISAVPRDDDPMMGSKQVAMLQSLVREISDEATADGVEYRPVGNALQGSEALILLEAV